MVKTPETLNQLFFHAVERYGTKRAAVRHKVDGTWRDVTHQALARQVKHAALGLRALGIAPGDRVAILSHNRPEWAIADFACLTIACADVPVYPTLPASHIQYLLKDSEAKAIFVDDAEQLDKIAAIRDTLPQLKHVIVFDPRESMVAEGLRSFRELLRQGEAVESDYPSYREDALRVEPGDLATLIYTSGTTGPPKGVMLTHGNFTSNVVGALRVHAIGPDDACLSVLPLSHSFERMAGHYTMFHGGATINYAEGIEQLAANLREVRPTLVLAVPRLFEKIYARVLDNATSGGALKRRIFFWARRQGEAWSALVLSGARIPKGLAARKAIADRLVFGKLRQRTGGRIRYFISGGAALNPEIAKFFFAAGMPVLEGYGLTETSPLIAVNTLNDLRIGSVGRPVPGVEVRIAEDGEILVRGPNVMRGYLNRPDATREAIDDEGWFRTGDVGTLDDGFLTITDRKKDIIVTAGGKNIAPQPIENLVKSNKFVVNAVMLGDRRKFPVMLVVPDREALAAWAEARRLPGVDDEGFLQQADVVAKIETEVMGTLRGLANYEMPKKLLVVDRDFTVESGELTPKLSVKRRVVEEHYRDRIDALYED